MSTVNAQYHVYTIILSNWTPIIINKCYQKKGQLQKCKIKTCLHLLLHGFSSLLKFRIQGSRYETLHLGCHIVSNLLGRNRHLARHLVSHLPREGLCIHLSLFTDNYTDCLKSLPVRSQTINPLLPTVTWPPYVMKAQDFCRKCKISCN